MRRNAATLALAGLCTITSLLRAQDPRIADSLLVRGAYDRAETEYYAAVRARPRDPNARWALGRYLIARGATRIGATLVDEAVQFGFDRRNAAPVLAGVYMDLGEYQSLDKLQMSPLSASEKAVVRWLAEHPSRTIATDSSVLVAFARPVAGEFVGSVRVRLNGFPVLAAISPRGGCGIRLSDTSIVAAKLRRYPSDSGGAIKLTPAIADSVGFGRMGVTNVPVEIEPLRGVQAVLCFNAIARYAPTFDPRAGLMILHLNGNAPAAPRATSLTLINLDGHYAVAQASGWMPVESPQVAAMLKDHRWTFDAKRGQLIVEP